MIIFRLGVLLKKLGKDHEGSEHLQKWNESSLTSEQLIELIELTKNYKF